jgi:hypothetical protein
MMIMIMIMMMLTDIVGTAAEGDDGTDRYFN